MFVIISIPPHTIQHYHKPIQRQWGLPRSHEKEDSGPCHRLVARQVLYSTGSFTEESYKKVTRLAMEHSADKQLGAKLVVHTIDHILPYVSFIQQLRIFILYVD